MGVGYEYLMIICCQASSLSLSEYLSNSSVVVWIVSRGGWPDSSHLYGKEIVTRNLSMLQPSLEPCDRFAHLSKCRRPALEVAASRNRAFSRLGCTNATLPRGPAHCRGVMRYVFSSPCPVGGGGWSFRSVHPCPYGQAAEDRESPAHPTEPRNPEVSLSTYNVTLNTQASIPSRQVALPELGRGFFDGAGQRWSQKLNRNLLSGWTAGGRFSDVYSSDECQMRAWVRVGMEDPSPTHPAPFHAT